MENKSFDHIIKGKLDQFSNEVDSNAWELFEESQAAAEFDGIINDKIGDFDSGEVPSDFNILLDEASKGFDALIGAKLAAMNISDGSDWEQFEKILDEDSAFDRKVSEAVENYKSPLEESQWPKLAEHLKKVEARRRRIVITKFIEAAVFLLFILTLMQLYPIQNISKQNVFRTIGVVEDLQYDHNKSDKNVEEQVEVVEDRVFPEALSSSNISPIAIKQFSSINSGELRSNSLRQKRTQGNLPLIPVRELKFSGNSILASVLRSDTKELSNDFDLSSEGYSYDDQLLATLDIKDLELNAKDFSYALNDISRSVKKEQWWFNVFGSPEFNLINTPYDRSYSDDRYILDDEVDAYAHASHGYSVGASISRETANYEFEGGIEYTSLNYFPKAISETTGKATTGFTTRLLKEIIFDIVEIPLTLKYTFFKKKGWKIYGNNGISVGMVAFANYDIESETGRPLASLESSRNSSTEVDESFINRKKFDPGFMRSGSVNDNIFATVNAGFGVSKEVSDKISFYVQPTYYHNLTQRGVGPNNDVHHRLSMQFGTKVRI